MELVGGRHSSLFFTTYCIFYMQHCYTNATHAGVPYPFQAFPPTPPGVPTLLFRVQP